MLAAVTPLQAGLPLSGAGGPAPPGPGRQIARLPAQRLARTELSRPMYHHTSIGQAITGFLNRLLNEVFNPGHHLPPGWWALAVLAGLAVALIAGVLLWTGPIARSRRAAPPQALAAGARTAREHLLAAEELARSGDYGSATLECVRAIAMNLQEREVLPPRPGRTADEFAAEAGRELPAEAVALRAAAAAFDAICYGMRSGSATGYQEVAALAARIGVGSRRVRAGAGAGAGPEPAGSPPS